MPRKARIDTELGDIFQELGLEPSTPSPAISKVPPRSPSSERPISSPPEVPPNILPSGDPPGNFSLRDFLADQFSRRDRWTKGLPLHSFQIDDCSPSDHYRPFCDITLTLPERENQSLQLELMHPPVDDAVLALVKKRRSQRVGDRYVERLTLDLKLTDVMFLRSLAKAIRRVVSLRHISRTGQRYDIPNWAWMAGRTAHSLDRFATAIWKYRQERRASKH